MYSKIRRITFYTRPGCHLCTAALDLLLELSHEIDGGLTIDEVNILEDPELYKRYRYAIPAIQIDPDAGGPTLTAPINAPELCRALGLDASRTSRPEINVGPNTPHSGGNK
jgi:glutaredoxin